MRSSADQPSSSMRVAASQIGSHPESQHEVPMPSMSNFEPDGFTWRNARPRWSWKPSMTISMKSELNDASRLTSDVRTPARPSVSYILAPT